MSNIEDLEDKLSRLEDNISEQLGKITHEVDDLYKTVYKGNGVPSLTTRISSQEDKLRGLREKMDCLI
jgi:predicted  nucleic acid-binding Zn-ribbon protein